MNAFSKHPRTEGERTSWPSAALPSPSSALDRFTTWLVPEVEQHVFCLVWVCGVPVHYRYVMELLRHTAVATALEQQQPAEDEDDDDDEGKDDVSTAAAEEDFLLQHRRQMQCVSQVPQPSPQSAPHDQQPSSLPSVPHQGTRPWWTSRRQVARLRRLALHKILPAVYRRAEHVNQAIQRRGLYEAVEIKMKATTTPTTTSATTSPTALSSVVRLQLGSWPLPASSGEGSRGGHTPSDACAGSSVRVIVLDDASSPQPSSSSSSMKLASARDGLRDHVHAGLDTRGVGEVLALRSWVDSQREDWAASAYCTALVQAGQLEQAFLFLLHGEGVVEGSSVWCMPHALPPRLVSREGNQWPPTSTPTSTTPLKRTELVVDVEAEEARGDAGDQEPHQLVQHGRGDGTRSRKEATAPSAVASSGSRSRIPSSLDDFLFTPSRRGRPAPRQTPAGATTAVAEVEVVVVSSSQSSQGSSPSSAATEEAVVGGGDGGTSPRHTVVGEEEDDEVL